MRLESFRENVWTLRGDLKLLGIEFGSRMTVVRLADGGLWVHSPVRISDEEEAAIRALGPVRYVVAPNLFHHLFLNRFAARFPEAEVWCPRGLEKKKKGDVPAHKVLGSEAHPWEEELLSHSIEGAPVLRETVFVHRASRTMVTADVVFHFNEIEGWWPNFFMKSLAAAMPGPKNSRLFRVGVKDRAAYSASIDALLETPFDAISLSHGELIHSDAHDALREATAWAKA